MSRDVTENDLRAPQFKGMKVEDLEFRDDGAIVRKDRWETTVRRIAGKVIGSRSQFECDQVADAVEKLADVDAGWISIPAEDVDDYPEKGQTVEVKMPDGSRLRNVVYSLSGRGSDVWSWGSLEFDTVAAWRDQE